MLSSPVRPCRLSNVLGLVIVGAYLCLWPDPGSAQQPPSCANLASPPEILLGCVRSLLASPGKDASQDKVPELLRKLAQASGYRGDKSDLDDLKHRSTELKRDPDANREMISLLDSAIASHIDEIGPAVSTQALADASDLGTDIYADFVRQKLTFLGSEKAKFYDKGPFEIAWRSLFASALEAHYFLDQKAAEGDKGELRAAIRVLDEILERRRGAGYSYLSDKRGDLTNSDLFWRASLLIAFGDRAETQKILRELISSTKDFGLDGATSNHIYIYKVFNFPHPILVQGDPERGGARKTEIKDPDILDRYYNAAQLALYTCSYLDRVGSANAISTFVSAIKNFELSDYYVVLATADSSAKMQDSATALKQKLSSEAIAGARELLMHQVASKEIPGFTETVRRGASACGIAEDVRDQIYSKFELQPSIVRSQGSGKTTEHLVVGGRLNSDQANVVAEFFNKVIFQTSESRDMTAKTEVRAYPARMKITQ